jgi:hypothetical protein
LKLPPADDAAGDFHERFVDGCEALESNAQALDVVVSGDCAFGDPSDVVAKAASVRLITTGDLGRDAGDTYWPMSFIVIVATAPIVDFESDQPSWPQSDGMASINGSSCVTSGSIAKK